MTLHVEVNSNPVRPKHDGFPEWAIELFVVHNWTVKLYRRELEEHFTLLRKE